MTIAPVIMLVIHLQGSYIVQFYDMTACVKAKDEIKKVERSLVTKCLATVTVEKKPDI